MTRRRAVQRGQATVEHVGVVVLVLTLVLGVTSVMVRSLHPPASPPDLVGRIADRLTAPLGSAPAVTQDLDAGGASPRPAGEALQPFWIAMNLHHHEAPIGRWLGAAKDAVVEHVPDMAKGCLKSVFMAKEAHAFAGARVRGEMGLGRSAARAARFLLKRPTLAACAVGAASALLPS